MNIFPNPGDGHFVVDLHCEGEEKMGIINVFNAIGQLIYERVVVINEGVIHYDVKLQNDAPDGIYFLKVMANGKIYSGQIICQK